MFYPYEVYHVALAYAKLLQGLALGGHDGSFLIVDRVGRVDFVVGVRSHTGDVLLSSLAISRGLKMPRCGLISGIRSP